MTPPPLDSRSRDPWSVRADYDALRVRHAALLAALDALVMNWRSREQQYRHLRPHDEATADTLRSCATELVAEVKKHQDVR